MIPGVVDDESWQDRRMRLGVIWGIVVAVAAIQVWAWLRAGAGAAPVLVVPIVLGWIVTLALAAIASRRIGRLTDRLTAKEHAHRATLDEVAQLQTQNAMLQIVARSVDVPLTFQALAGRIARLVPCDRVGLALLTEDGREFVTSTARVHEDERRTRARADVVFKVDQTAIGAVVRSGEPMLVPDLKEMAADFLDSTVTYNAGFRSALIMPLISNGRGVGTLNVVARSEGAFRPEHVEILRPIAEILAVAHVAQQLHMLVGRYRTTEAMAEVMLTVANDINGALQIIVGHCNLLERSHPDPALHRDLATVVRQAQRIAELLEKMRAAAHERLKEVATTMEATGIPTSPEDYEQPNQAV